MKRYTEEDTETVLLHVHGTLTDAIDYFTNMKIAIENEGKDFNSEYAEIAKKLFELQNDLEEHWYNPEEEERELREEEEEANKAVNGQIALLKAGMKPEKLSDLIIETSIDEAEIEEEENKARWEEIAKQGPTPGWPLDYK